MMKLLKNIIEEEVTERYDHRNLNLDIEEFANLNPTAENIVVVAWERLREKIDPHLDLAVRLYETERNYVEFTGRE